MKQFDDGVSKTCHHRGCGDALMAITMPSGRPNRRFMRYVRPPVEHNRHRTDFKNGRAASGD